MDLTSFELLLRYLSLELQKRPKGGAPWNEGDDLKRAISHLSQKQREQVIAFVNDSLASAPNSKALADVFADGQLYFVWQNDDAPRRLLLAIRDAASSEPSFPSGPL